MSHGPAQRSRGNANRRPSQARRRARRRAGSLLVVVAILAVGGTALYLGPLRTHPGRPKNNDPGGEVTGSRPSTTPTTAPPTTPPTTSPAPATGVGTAGTYSVKEVSFTFVDTTRVADVGGHDVPRSLPTLVRYPAGPAASASSGVPQDLRPGTYPLVVFAPGYLQCRSAYAPLLQTWASAGYVVAAVQFPLTSCHEPTGATENDIVNQPGDVSFVINQLLTVSSAGQGPLDHLIDPNRIALAGHSDGGDTVAAVAANGCCADPRVKATVVLAGAELASMGGPYFASPTEPMLFVQGTADTINVPSDSETLYNQDTTGTRDYLQLDGATHVTPYEGSNPPEPTVAAVTLDFFDLYVMGQAGAASSMQHYGNVPGVASLVSGGTPPPAVTTPPG
ncbi:MAG: alpha/beta hydrolase family protein [Acidimicrobiales bacterium]